MVTVYKLFLLVWIIIGLGYVVMVMGFISKGLRSKRVHHIERTLARNIKKTPFWIRQELRGLIQEFLLLKVKRGYKGEFVYTPTLLEKSESCPDLTIYRDMNSPTMMRKRAFSACVYDDELSQVQSEDDVRVDSDLTFTRRLSAESNLLIRVANALDNLEDGTSPENERGGGAVHGFSDREILSSENSRPRIARQRARSEIKFPFGDKIREDEDLTWYGPSATLKLQAIREKASHGKARSRTLPVQPPGFLTKIKNTITGQKERDADADVERQEGAFKTIRSRANSVAPGQYLKETRAGRKSLLPGINDTVLEETSIAEFLRALTAITVPEASGAVPQRKMGTASLTPPKESPLRIRRFAIRPVQSRRSSLMPSNADVNSRRLSLRPPSVDAHFLSPTPPPPYTPLVEEGRKRMSIRVPGSNRRYSLRPVSLIASNSSPVQKQVYKSKDRDDGKDSFS